MSKEAVIFQGSSQGRIFCFSRETLSHPRGDKSRKCAENNIYHYRVINIGLLGVL